MAKYTPIIGLEIHIELATKSKMFCGCPADHFGKAPNTQVCPVCLGLPGALPVPNKQAIFSTLRFGKALGCSLARDSKFDRKHYFYPDLPKAYQISQYDMPLCFDGSVHLDDIVVGVERVHLEEDTGKLKHTELDGKKVSLVDYNRSSVPLMEIVSEPDIRSGEQAYAYAKQVALVAQYVGVSDADMEKGSMRLEANISLATDEQMAQGKLPDYKVEVKNINSFRFLQQAIEYEIGRHTEMLDAGKTPKQETRGWNERKNETFSQRSKESAKDYRYFPDPDIPPLRFDDALMDEILSDMPMLSDEVATLMRETYKIREDYVAVLITNPSQARLALEAFALAKKDGHDATKVANHMVNTKGDFSDMTASDLVGELFAEAEAVSDDVYDTWIEDAIAGDPDAVAKFKSGKKAVIGALIGGVMKASKGKADPKVTREKLLAHLDS